LAEGEDKEKLKKAIDKQTMAIVTAAENIKKELHAVKKEGGFWLFIIIVLLNSFFEK
jgi:5S rRNA maturation endonuclease (ribonuclease M5)